MMLTPPTSARYAVVSPSNEAGPADVSFWDSHESVIFLLARYSNIAWYTSQGFSVWHRRTAQSQWKLITDTST